MNNPRSRDFMRQTPHMTAPAKLPAIPVASPGNVLDVLRAIKEHLDVRTGGAGNPFEQWVTVREIFELGLMQPKSLAAAPPDTAGVPVWTTRGRFELVTAAALAALLGVEDAQAGVVSTDDLAALRRQIAAIRASPSVDEAALALLPIEWRADIDAALRKAYGRIDLLQSEGEQAAAAAAAAQSTAATTLNTVIDFGQCPRKNITVEFEAAVTEGQVVRMQPNPAADLWTLGGDELEMDVLVASAQCLFDGVVTAYITANPGPVCGSRNFHLQIG